METGFQHDASWRYLDDNDSESLSNDRYLESSQSSVGSSYHLAERICVLCADNKEGEMSVPVLVNSAACNPGSLTRDFMSGLYSITVSLKYPHGKGRMLIARGKLADFWCMNLLEVWEAPAKIFERKNDGK